MDDIELLDRLLDVQARSGWSLVEIARRTKIGASTLSRITNGKIPIGRLSRRKLELFIADNLKK